MTADEARAVIALWQQERVAQTGLTDRPAVPDVAEGLDVPVEEVQHLLGEVRARRVEEERGLAQEQELAQAEAHLAEEEFELASIQQRRADMRLAKAEHRIQAESDRQGVEIEPVPWEVWKAAHPPVKWVETKPNIWEDVNQQSPPHLTSAGTKVGAALLYLVWSLALSLLAWIGWLSGLWGPH